ncbi:MAG: asparagine synthase (glutamine-hydrolyzing) [Pirellulales bacterium]
MCGIAGAFDLTGRRDFPTERLLRMTGAIVHRGPDDEQIYAEPGVALGVRRLSIIDIAGGRQPLSNEDGSVWVGYEGELYEYPDIRKDLLARGHHLRTSCDTEAWVHLYEDHGEGVFSRAHGQFGVSLWDQTNRTLFLARDRVGISPLFYTEADGWLLWASEIKAILASGMVDARPDPRGFDYFFNFLCLPNDLTCFAGIRSLPPGHYMTVKEGRTEIRQYWDLDFPDAGAERRFDDVRQGVDEFEETLRAAIRRRLCGEAPLSCYISGGLDSTTIMGLSIDERGEPIPSLTAGLVRSGPNDERAQAAESARLLGSKLTTVEMTEQDIADTYPDLILAAEGPVLDTSATCMIRLARKNREIGNLVVLTGEGADEALAGYMWFKWHRLQRVFNAFGYPINRTVRGPALYGLIGGGSAHSPAFRASGGYRVAQQIKWEFLAQSREHLYSDKMWATLDGFNAYDHFAIPHDRFGKWHWLNQSLYAAYKTLLPGMLLSAKGDRSTRSGSTEGRYPFLDERVVNFCASLAPEYKLRGLQDKWILRQVAKKVLPPAIAGRPKTMFRANMGKVFTGASSPAWITQLLSPESLAATGFFDVDAVTQACQLQLQKPRKNLKRFSLDMGLAGVVSTQLWHHIFCGGGLADLPSWSPPSVDKEALDACVVMTPAGR